jgi:hypothetical protein
MHEIGDEAARQCDFSNRSAHALPGSPQYANQKLAGRGERPAKTSSSTNKAF